MSQLSEYTRYSFKNYWRLLINKIKLGFCGDKVYFEKNVQLLRFPKNIEINSKSHIKEGAKICSCNPEATIVIGEGTSIGYNTIIFSSSNITIGNFCMIAPNVYIVDSDHGMDRESLMKNQTNSTEPIEIGNDVWIATGAVILRGTRIPDGCVIAANSVVKGELEPYSIYAGSPAKKIGQRK